MRGRRDYNYPLFQEAASTLRSKGHQVVSPAELDQAYDFKPDGTTDSLPSFLRDCFLRIATALVTVDAIVLLPDYQDSKGVEMERAIAGFLGIPVYYYDQGALFKEQQHVGEARVG